MAEFDFAILGSSPLAGLLAGLLAREHGRRVALVGAFYSPFRIDRGLDLSLAPITRPETWMLLERTVPETVRVLSQISRSALARATLAAYADSADTRIGLHHVQHMAAGFGHDVERQAPLPDQPAGFTYRDVRVLRRDAFSAGVVAWLGAAGVRWLLPANTEISLRRDGSAMLRVAGEPAGEARRAVLADEAAILAHLDAEDRDPLLIEAEATAILTSAARRMTQRVSLYPDRGIWLRQHGSRAISAVATGSGATALERIGSCLPPGDGVRRAGQAVFRGLSVEDGAPLVGNGRAVKAAIIAGLGPTAAFQAPALARFLAGASSEAEAAYFAARAPGRGQQRRDVAEFAPALPERAA